MVVYTARESVNFTFGTTAERRNTPGVPANGNINNKPPYFVVIVIERITRKKNQTEFLLE